MNVTAANTIYPASEAETERRRKYQTGAIICCEQILQETRFREDVLPVAVSKFLPYVDAIEKEILLLKGWRKANRKINRRAKKTDK
jgi:hypothetical protein